MKKIVIHLGILCCLLSGLPVMAQTDYVEEAKVYYEKKNFKKAKEVIDKAIEQPETAMYADVWYYKGIICEALYQEEHHKSAPGTRQAWFAEALQAYRRVPQAKDFNDLYKRTTQQRIELFFRELVNEGIAEYQKKTFNRAVELFDRAVQLKPADTTTLAYAQSAALFAREYATAGKYMVRLLQEGYSNVRVYENYLYVMSSLASAEQVDVTLIRQVRERFPANRNLLNYETNLLIRLGKASEALENIRLLLQVDVNNPVLHLNLGLLSELTGNLEEAERSYMKVIELDSLNHQGLYSLGAYYYNMAVKQKMESADVQDNGQNTDVLLKKSLPYLEKAIRLNPGNTNTQLALCNVYTRLGMVDAAKNCGK